MSLIEDFVLAHIEKAKYEMFTALPARITDVSQLSINLISVQPSIREVISSTVSYDMPIIPDVPVQWPSGGGAIMTFPLAVGDDVLLVFSSRSIEEWLVSALDTVTPVDLATHNLSDAIAIPCVFRENTLIVNPTDVEIKYSGSEITIKQDSEVELTTPNSTTTMAANGDITTSNAVGTFSISSTGDISLTNSTATVDILNSGDISLSNSTATVDILNSGNITLDNGSSTIEALSSGVIDLTNSIGNITLQANGDANINGAIIDAATGNVVTASGTDLDALKTAYNLHTHPDPVSGSTGTTSNPV